MTNKKKGGRMRLELHKKMKDLRALSFTDE